MTFAYFRAMLGSMRKPPTAVDDDAPRRMLTAADVADILQISREQVYRLVSRGELRGTKLGEQTLRIDPADLAAWLADRPAA